MGLTDQLELVAAVDPRLTDQVRLEASVFSDRLSDAVSLQISVTPRLADGVLLAASVMNQAFEAAAQSQVIAPVVEVTWPS